MTMHLPRHTLVWIDVRRRDGFIRCVEDVSAQALVDEWLARDRPLIVRRRDAATDADHLALGVPLPPAEGRRRIAVAARPDIVVRACEPPLLRDTAGRLPAAWRRPLDALVADLHSNGVAPRVYGSALWEAITGLSYLGPDSDIDLLWRPRSEAELEAACASIQRWEARYGRRADGEFLLQDGAAVSWREWSRRSEDGRVIVKRIDGAALCARAEIAARLRASPMLERAA